MSTKKIPAKKKKLKETKPAAQQIPERGSDETLDFGGLPARDLKKNLGCG